MLLGQVASLGGGASSNSKQNVISCLNQKASAVDSEAKDAQQQFLVQRRCLVHVWTELLFVSKAQLLHGADRGCGFERLVLALTKNGRKVRMRHAAAHDVGVCDG